MVKKIVIKIWPKKILTLVNDQIRKVPKEKRIIVHTIIIMKVELMDNSMFKFKYGQVLRVGMLISRLTILKKFISGVKVFNLLLKCSIFQRGSGWNFNFTTFCIIILLLNRDNIFHMLSASTVVFTSFYFCHPSCFAKPSAKFLVV